MNTYDGIKISDKNAEKVKGIIADPELQKLRKVITQYKSRSDDYAMFRMSARRMLNTITVRKILKKPLKVEQKQYIYRWVRDSNPMFKNYMDRLETLIRK